MGRVNRTQSAQRLKSSLMEALPHSIYRKVVRDGRVQIPALAMVLLKTFCSQLRGEQLLISYRILTYSLPTGINPTISKGASGKCPLCGKPGRKPRAQALSLKQSQRKTVRGVTRAR